MCLGFFLMVQEKKIGIHGVGQLVLYLANRAS